MIKSFNTCSAVHLRFAPAKSRSLLLLAMVIVATAVSAATSSAQTIEATKIVYRRTGPSIAPDSPEAKPITIYRAGDKYLRIEYPSDPAHGTHSLSLTREPDAWSINLVDHTAQHFLDTGPAFVVRYPIIWSQKPPGQPDPDERFQTLEFGNEAAFFRQNSPRDLGMRKIDGKDAKAFAIKSGSREVTLFLEPNTEKPLRLDVTNDGKPFMSFHYLTYATDLRFDPALFEPPSDLKITEKK